MGFVIDSEYRYLYWWYAYAKKKYIHMAMRPFRNAYDARALFRYADEVCRQGMPTGYADRVCRQAVPTGCHRDPIRDNEEIQPPIPILVRNCQERGMPTHLCRQPMPTTYADDLCRHPMPTTYADNLCRRPTPLQTPRYAEKRCF